jgi:hypothetical protein
VDSVGGGEVAVHLLIILVLAIWIGFTLTKLSKKESLKLLRGISILALVAIGLLALVIFVYTQVNETFGIVLFFLSCGVGVVGGLVWLVVKSGKMLKE